MNIVHIGRSKVKARSTSKEEIIKISREIVKQKGISEVNMRSVAKKNGISLGCIYNYFPSKSNLLCSIVEDVFFDIFHMTGNEFEFDSFKECISWFFSRITMANEEYPEFLMLHSFIFERNDKNDGREIMEKYLLHIKSNLIKVIEKDIEIRNDAFNENLTPEKFIEYVFHLFMFEVKNNKDFKAVMEIIERSVY